MRPPKRVKLGSRTIDVAVMPAVFDGMSEQPGLSQMHERRVVLCASTPPDTQRETMLHELLHQVLHLAGLTVPHDDVDPDLSEKDEERLVIRVAPILLGLIRENPSLVTFLTERAP